MNLIRALLGLALLGGALGGDAHAQEAISFKGFPLGGPMSEFRAKFPDFDCTSDFCMFDRVRACARRGASSEQTIACFKRNTYGGVTAVSVSAGFTDGGLRYVRVGILPKDFENLSSAMTERYGAPGESKSETIRTKAGVEYVNATNVWVRPEGAIRLSRYGSTTERGIVIIASAAYAAEAIEREKARQKAAPKDL